MTWPYRGIRAESENAVQRHRDLAWRHHNPGERVGVRCAPTTLIA